jgi:ATP-dependent helicase/DNAse subunit B
VEEAVAAAAEEAEATEYVGHPAVWKLGRERARRMAIRVLSTAARGLPFEGHFPEHLELAFGRPDSIMPWRRVMLPAAAGEREIYFEGKIDRLDRAGERLGVLDYKSRSPKAVYQSLLSTEFQMPLYLYACKTAGHRGDLSAAWFGLKDAKVTSLNKSLAMAGVTLESLLTTDPKDRAMIAAFGGKNFANAVHQLVSEMRSGHFPARPHDCKYCSYRAVCRISERRIPEANGE